MPPPFNRDVFVTGEGALVGDAFWISGIFGGRSGGIGFSRYSLRGGNCSDGSIDEADAAPSSFLIFEQHENVPFRSTVAYSMVFPECWHGTDCPFRSE